MNLGKLIAFLEKLDPDKAAHIGFGNPHSYRGYYHNVAFEIVRDTTVEQMLREAKSAVGSTYGGWKGGDYTMGEYSAVWLAEEGCTGETLGEFALLYMLGE